VPPHGGRGNSPAVFYLGAVLDAVGGWFAECHTWDIFVFAVVGPASIAYGLILMFVLPLWQIRKLSGTRGANNFRSVILARDEPIFMGLSKWLTHT